MSAILSAIGLYLLSTLSGNSVFFGAIIFGMGVCYFWPTMLGFVAENIPESGALGLNILGGAGMFAVSVYTYFMGQHYDALLVNKLPAGADIKEYITAAPGSEMATQLAQATSAAGPEVIQATLVIPIILSVAFAGLVIFMKARKNKISLQTA